MEEWKDVSNTDPWPRVGYLRKHVVKLHQLVLASPVLTNSDHFSLNRVVKRSKAGNFRQLFNILFIHNSCLLEYLPAMDNSVSNIRKVHIVHNAENLCYNSLQKYSLFKSVARKYLNNRIVRAGK